MKRSAYCLTDKSDKSTSNIRSFLTFSRTWTHRQCLLPADIERLPRLQVQTVTTAAAIATRIPIATVTVTAHVHALPTVPTDTDQTDITIVMTDTAITMSTAAKKRLHSR